jgi:hypothetical protein
MASGAIGNHAHRLLSSHLSLDVLNELSDPFKFISTYQSVISYREWNHHSLYEITLWYVNSLKGSESSLRTSGETQNGSSITL